MYEPDLGWITSEIEGVQAHHRARVEALYAGQRPAEVIAIAGRDYGSSHGLWGTDEIDMLTQPEAWLQNVLADMAAHTEDFSDRVTFRPLVIEIDPLGTHFCDALFGAGTRLHAGQVWGQGLECGPGELQMPDLQRSELLQRSLDLTRYVVQATRGRILVTTPVLSCPMNIGMNLFGQRFVESFAAEPDAARHALAVIHSVILACVRVFAAAIPEDVRRTTVACNRYAPAGYGFIDGCATQLVSQTHYRELVAPLDADLLAASPHGGMIHLCGAHEQHVATWATMAPVRSVQLNDRASEELEAYVRGLRHDQILYVSPTETMTVERILRVTEGERLVLQAPLEAPIRL